MKRTIEKQYKAVKDSLVRWSSFTMRTDAVSNMGGLLDYVEEKQPTAIGTMKVEHDGALSVCIYTLEHIGGYYTFWAYIPYVVVRSQDV